VAKHLDPGKKNPNDASSEESNDSAPVVPLVLSIQVKRIPILIVDIAKIVPPPPIRAHALNM
jgi:hypothetical protein